MTKRNQSLIFDISSLLEAGTGTTELYSFEGPACFEGIIVKSPIEGKIEVMRIEQGVNVRFYNVELTVEFQCAKCLKSLTRKIQVDGEERIFHLDPPKKTDDPNDLFLIDKKHQKIDATEPLRQEIILHFPSIPVCYTGCKGICHVCGQDRNQKDCTCKTDESAPNKPLAALKDLIK